MTLRKSQPRARSRRHIFTAAATLSAASLALTACGAGGGSSPTGGADGAEKLTVVVEGGGLAELQPIADLYTDETGTEVELVELPYDGLYNRINSELTSGAVSFDIAALDAIWLPAFAEAVVPLDDLYTGEVEGDLFPGLLQEAQVDGAYVGMPVWTNSEILFYRTDLFEDEAEQTAFEEKYGYPLAPPADWEQYRDVAEFFTRDTDGDGETDLYGTDVKGAVETEWLATVSQAGADAMVLDGDTVTVNDAEHVEALDFYTSLLPYAPSGSAQLDWGGAQNLFYQGQLAMMRFWGHAYPQTPEDSVVKDKVGAAPMIAGPGGVAGVPGAWYLSVPQASQNQETAKEFIAFAYENNALSVETSLGLAARVSAFEEYAGRAGYEHYAALLETLNSPATKPRPATPEWQEIVDTVLTPTLQKAIEDNSDTQALLDEAKTQIEAILQ
jgi:ABC-type glycerol-3-phosphate transport system substrate-binding protein